MSDGEREALAVALRRTIAISVAIAVLVMMVFGEIQKTSIERRLDALEQILRRAPQHNSNSVIIGHDKAELVEKLARENLSNAGLHN